MGYEDLDVSALLLVRQVKSWMDIVLCFILHQHRYSFYLFFHVFIRCLPGYPYKCPKLQITPEKGLTKNEADNLLSLLNDQVCSDFCVLSFMLFHKSYAGNNLWQS